MQIKILPCCLPFDIKPQLQIDAHKQNSGCMASITDQLVKGYDLKPSYFILFYYSLTVVFYIFIILVSNI